MNGFFHESVKPSRRKKRDQGFTLVELLTAIAVLALITLFLGAAANQATRLSTQGNSLVEYREKARAALDYIGMEMQSALLSSGSNNGPLGLEFVVNPTSVTSAFRDSIFWQAPIATDNSKGDLAEVGYFVRWNGSTPSLCRFFVNPSNRTNYLVYNTASWVSDGLLNTVAPADKANKYQGLFLENVLGLWVNAYQVDGVTTYIGDSRVSGHLPAFVQISLVFIDSGTAQKLTTANVSVIQSHYSGSSTAQDFVSSLPAVIKPGASIATIRVCMENYK